MKKNYLFLISFTLFIFLSVIVKSYCDYPMWPTIVSAVTVASFFFSFADLTGVKGRAMRNLSEETIDGIDCSLFEISKIKSTLSKLIECTSENEKAHYLTTKNNVDALENHYLRAQSIMKRDIKISSGLKITSILFTMVGFLLLFSIMTFDSFANWFIGRQDIMTVMSFGCILLSQLLDTLIDDAREHWRNLVSNLNKALDALKKTYETDLNEELKNKK